MRSYALLAGLAAVACAGASPDSGAHPVSGGAKACTLEGEAFAGISADRACDIFRQALAAEAGPDAAKRYRIVLTARSADSARAVVSDNGGAVIVDLDFDVMDTALSPATWEQFARAVAREVARKQAG